MANQLQKFIRFVVVAVKLEARQVRRAIKRHPGKKPEIVTVLHVQAHAPFIPLELKDMILEHLQGDDKSLTACSLIASDWTPAAQRRLFRSLTLAIGPIGHHTNTPALVPRDAPFPTNLAPHLTHYITALHIRPRKSYLKHGSNILNGNADIERNGSDGLGRKCLEDRGNANERPIDSSVHGSVGEMPKDVAKADILQRRAPSQVQRR